MTISLFTSPGLCSSLFSLDDHQWKKFFSIRIEFYNDLFPLHKLVSKANYCFPKFSNFY